MIRSSVGIALLLPLALLAGCGGSRRSANPSGALEAVEIEIAPTLAGRLLEVRPQLGDQVAAGDTLIIVDTELIALQRIQTASGLASIAAQRRVSEQNLAASARSLQWLDTSLERTRQVVQQGSATPNQLDELQARRDIAAHQLDAARDQLQVLTAEETRLNAALKVFDRQLGDGVISAPVSGVVILRAAEPSEVAQIGRVCLKLADITRLEMRFFLDATDLDRVKMGQRLHVIVDALPDQPREGTVTWISPEAEFTPKNAQTRQARTQLVYAVKLALDNRDLRLHVGMTGEVMVNQ
jgi:HlyD family secretion protein